MTITESGWTGYIDRLAAINNTAARKFVAFLNTHETATAEGRKLALDYASALVQKYGESAAAVACEMYDAVAEASGVLLPAAEPAAVATYGEVAKTVNGIMKQSDNPEYISSGVSRLVKQAGVDTTAKNAIRDGAEWAWVPHGDTCSFCLMLASNGWQKASKKALKGDHAEHVHANCDCTYAIRFDSRMNIAGYDPDALYEQYQSAEGDTWQEKLNSMRRANYAENADKIRAQKREAYARRIDNTKTQERERLHTSYPNTVQKALLDSPGYTEKFDGITGNPDVDTSIYESAKEIFDHRAGTNYEDLHLIDANTGEVIHRLTTCNIPNAVEYDEETIAAIEKAHKEGRKIIAIHNHPGGLPPSLDDGVSVYNHGYAKGIVVGHNLEVYTYGATDQNYNREQCKEVHKAITNAVQFSIDFEDDVWYNYLKLYGMEVSRR